MPKAAVNATDVEVRHRWACAGLGVALAAPGYRSLLRPWHEHWGATEAEVRSTLPGDGPVAETNSQATRAITVDTPADQVWPSVVELGADHRGFCSYDWLESLFRLGIHSADRVAPDWQQRVMGDMVYAAGTGG
jgi:hypothetical protein